MPWLEDIVTQLTTDNVVTSATVTASTKAVIPKITAGTAVLQLVETGGSGPTNFQNDPTQAAFQNPGMMLIARGSDYRVARDLARAAYVSLVKVRNTHINGTFYQTIKALNEPHDLGLDEQGNARCGFSILGAKQP